MLPVYRHACHFMKEDLLSLQGARDETCIDDMSWLSLYGISCHEECRIGFTSQ